MSVSQISESLAISADDALEISQKLIELGGFIDMPETEFEAMHPRFTAVNMYRKMCERENIDFSKSCRHFQEKHIICSLECYIFHGKH